MKIKGERPDRVNRNRSNLVNGTNPHMCGCGYRVVGMAAA